MLRRLTQWTLAGWRRRRETAEQNLALHLLAQLAEPAPVRQLPPWHDVPQLDSTNACKDGRARCRECRLGGDCREQDRDERPAYAAGLTLPRDGQHTITVRLAHWARIDRLHQLRDELGWQPAFARGLP